MEAGVVQFADDSVWEAVKEWSTFSKLPTEDDLIDAAYMVVYLAKLENHKKALIGDAPFFMRHLEDMLIIAGITPVYAFSERVSSEETLADGSAKKTNMSKHVGFIEVK